MAFKNNEQLRVQTLSPLINISPYFPCTELAGCVQYTIYTHMYFPIDYGRNPVVEYEALTQRATMADVCSERQVDIKGPDAMKLADYLVTKDISNLPVGNCAYSFCCDDTGKVITDPVIMRIGEDQIWLSGSDADLLLWVKGFSVGGNWDVTVSEPDCSPFQIQGPSSGEILKALVDPAFLKLKRFQIMKTKILDIDVMIGRLGWSREYGFEIFPLTSEKGEELWNAILEAGEPYGLMVTAPNYANAIESGITTYCMGSNDNITPLSLWRPTSVDLDKSDFLGKAALEKIVAEGGPDRLEIGIVGPEDFSQRMQRPWELVVNGQTVGKARQVVYSPKLERAIGIGFIKTEHAEVGTKVSVRTTNGEELPFEVVKIPFISSRG